MDRVEGEDAGRPGRMLDGPLSQRCRAVWPGALVFVNGGREWILERPGHEPLGLGDCRGHADDAVDALLAAERLTKGE